MIRFLRFCLGGIFLILAATLMDKRDIAEIFEKWLKSESEE